MLDLKFFTKCIRDNLADRRFGKERADEIVGMFEDRARFHMENGTNESDAAAIAMRETFDNISKEATERAKRTAKQLQVQAAARDRITKAMEIDTAVFVGKNEDGTTGSRGKALAHAVMSMIAPDKRFGGMSYEAKRDLVTRQMYALFGDALEPIRKGAFGRQIGKAHLPNVVREVFGTRTGDKAAERVAQAFRRVDDFGVDMFNQAGGSLNKLKNYFPQPARNLAKIIKGGESKFVDMHKAELDWNRTRWPDGSMIKESEREAFLKAVYDTKRSDGANKIDDTAFRGQGRALGNLLDQNRLLHYKDGDAWLRVHEAYGDGNVLDIMNHHISDMSHHIAAVDVFGPNPDMGFKNMQQIARKAAYNAGLPIDEVKKMESILSNKVQQMFNINMRKNPMNAEGLIAATTTAVTNVLTSAYLGGASIPAFFGDMAVSAVINKSNKMSAFGGMGTYLKAMTTDKAFQRRIAAQTGWIHEQSVMAINGAERYNPLITMGDKYSALFADAVMRASLNTVHTTNARWKVQSEFMGFLNSLKDTAFDDLPIKAVMERYNINAKDWDDLRMNVETFSPRADVNFLAPIKVLDTNLKNKQQLFDKFQGMILEESQTAVPASRTESRVTLKGDTRPDTLVGVILHSFGTFKNFPMSYFTILGRHAMTMPSAKSRVGFFAAVAAATTVAGLLAVQTKELQKGREAIPLVDSEGNVNMKLLGKAFMTGGGVGIWGDFLWGSVNQYGQGPQDVVGGPLVDVVGDVTDLAFGDLMGYAEEGLDYDSKTLERLVGLGRKVQPGQNLWYAELVFQRLLWDSIEDIVDPDVATKRRRKMKKREDEYGNGYWWRLGEKLPEGLQ
jgi:hypothetical protein